MLSAMEYPHWLMIAGAVLVVVGFIGFAFHKKPDENPLGQATTLDPIQAALEAEMKTREMSNRNAEPGPSGARDAVGPHQKNLLRRGNIF